MWICTITLHPVMWGVSITFVSFIMWIAWLQGGRLHSQKRTAWQQSPKILGAESWDYQLSSPHQIYYAHVQLLRSLKRRKKLLVTTNHESSQFTCSPVEFLLIYISWTEWSAVDTLWKKNIVLKWKSWLHCLTIKVVH